MQKVEEVNKIKLELTKEQMVILLVVMDNFQKFNERELKELEGVESAIKTIETIAGLDNSLFKTVMSSDTGMKEATTEEIIDSLKSKLFTKDHILNTIKTVQDLNNEIAMYNEFFDKEIEEFKQGFKLDTTN